MASLAEIRRHIRSVRNIAQVTRAMQMVSTSKMRRAQDHLLKHRDYVGRAWRLLTHLAAERRDQEGVQPHPLLLQRPVRRIELLLVTSSRGFCGALNHTVIQLAAQFILKQSVPVRLVTVGSKGRDWMLYHGQRIIAEFASVSDERALAEIGSPVAEVLLGDFQSEEVDAVYMVYAEFINTLVQKPTLRKLLPVAQKPVLGPGVRHVYTFEPGRQVLLADLLPRLIELQVCLALCESMASVHSARMVAMREANQSADEMLDHLTQMANRQRQSAITQEVLEVTEGARFTSSLE